GGAQQHRAASDVAAEEQALRAAQDFDALEVEGVEEYARADTQIDPIDENADGRVDRGDRTVDAEAADREIRVARCRADAFERGVGNRIADTGDRARMDAVELV